jgi:hypothetical protein
MALLRDGRADAALILFDQHLRAFPSGLLAEEREAHSVFALCQLDHVDAARERARRFIKTFPTSLLRSRVTGACDSTAAIRKDVE